MKSFNRFKKCTLAVSISCIFAQNAIAQDVNRAPECLREQLVVQEMTSKISTTGTPQGIEIILGSLINDPSYSGGDWSKYQYGIIDRRKGGGDQYFLRYTVTVHYMYNRVTGQVAQVKLKNTKEAGCYGVWVQSGNIDLNNGTIMIPRPHYEYHGNFDSLLYNYVIVVGPLTESYGVGCVHVDSLLPDGRRAGDIKVGDKLELGDENQFDEVEKKFKSSTGVVTFSKKVSAAGFRITTSSGARLICSDTAPIPTRATGLVLAPQLLNKFVPVKTSIAGGAHCGWEEVVLVESMGPIDVQHITVGDRCFWAGETQDAFILHHNLKMIESSGTHEPWWPW